MNKAFIIDDEESICLLLSAMLRKKNFITETHHQLGGAIAKLNQFSPDFIFLDLSLGDGSGFSLVPAIKENLPNTKIIISSAHSGSSERKEAKILGVDHFISKPLTKETIDSVINLLENK